MKKHLVTLILLTVSLIGLANPAAAADHSAFNTDLTPENAVILLDHQLLSTIEGASMEHAVPSRYDFVNCTIKIKMEIDGVVIEGKLTIYDISLFKCAAIKIGKFFNDLF